MDLFELSAKIELDTGEYENSVKSASKAADKVEDSIEGAGKAAGKAENSFNGLGESTEKSGKSSKKSASTAKMLGEVLKRLDQIVANTAKETGDTADSMDELADAFENAEDAADDLEESTENASKGTENLGKSASKTNGFLLMVMMQANLFADALSKAGEVAIEIGKYIWNLDEATEEYRNSQAKLNTAFRVAGFSADTAKAAYQGLYRVTGDIDQATEAAQLLSQLALSTEQVAQWTEIATGVVGTFGDSLPIESLIESANETARVGQVTGTLADALNWAGTVGEDEFNAMLKECATQAERTDLITQVLTETYQDAAATFEETSSSLMSARDSMIAVQEASGKTGEAIADLKTSMDNTAHYAKIGFYNAFTDLANSLTGFNNSMKSNKDLYRDWVKSVETKIKTGNIDEVTEAFNDLQRVTDFFADHPLDAIFQFGGFFSAYGANNEISRLQDLFFNFFNGTEEGADGAAEAEGRYTEASVEAAEASETIIAAADGVSVALEGTELTAEEASAGLQTYTSAALDMFGQISTESELSYEDLLENLEHNWQATNDFANNLQSLAGSLPPALYETFTAGGPQAYAGIVAMLAEANRGADEGLSELNRQYSYGGDAAVKAFLTALGNTPQNAENPATITAKAMEQDASMETAAVAVTTRAGTAISDSVETAGFDAAGEAAIHKFADGMENVDVSAAAASIASNAASGLTSGNFYGAGADAIQRFINGMESKRWDVQQKANSLSSDAVPSQRGGSGRAGGLDIVPYNGYPAVLHAGEAVLTAREAKAWRSGEGGAPSGRGVVINQYITAVPQTPAEFAAATQAYFQEAVWAL